jgi:hypothetical protein
LHLVAGRDSYSQYKNSITGPNMSFRFASTVLLAGLLAGCATSTPGEIDLPSFSHLALKASDSNRVNVSGGLLRFAARFTDDDEAKQLLAGLESVQVRNFDFSKPGAYETSDLDAVRKQLASPRWQQIVKVRSRAKNETVDVFLCFENDKTCGITVISAEEQSLTIVNVAGTIDIEKLAALQGEFGIPKSGLIPSSAAD